jgi:hypothetical protein
MDLFDSTPGKALESKRPALPDIDEFPMPNEMQA